MAMLSAKVFQKLFDSSALKQPQFRLYFIATAFSSIAVWMGRFMFGWLIWQQTESFFWVGIISAALLVPTLFITPLFGVVTDRINLKKGLMLWLGCQSVVAFVAFLFYSLFQPSLISLLVIAFSFGCIASAGSPLRLSLIPRLVDKQVLPNAVGLGAMLFNSSRVLAPACAAALLTVLNAEMIFLIAALFFATAVFFNAQLNDLPAAEREHQQSKLEDLIGGFRFAYRSSFILLMLLMTLINSQVGRALLELLPALSGTFTSGDAHDLAVLTACSGAGSILGAFFISKQQGDRQHLTGLIMMAMLLSALTLLPILLRPPVVLLAALVCLISLLMTLIGTGAQISIQLSTPDDIRGRVMSIWIMIALGGPAVGAFFMGAVAEFLGFNWMLLIMIALSSFGAVWLSVQRKSLTTS